MKANSEPPTGYIVIAPGPGPYDRECAAIVTVIQQRLDAAETATIHQGAPGDAHEDDRTTIRITERQGA